MTSQSADPLQRFRPTAADNHTFIHFTLADAISWTLDTTDPDDEEQEKRQAAQKVAEMLENATPEQLAHYRMTLQSTGHHYSNFFGEAFTEMGEHAIETLSVMPDDAPTPEPGPASFQVNIQRTGADIVRVTPGRLVAAVRTREQTSRIMEVMLHLPYEQQATADQAVADAIEPHALALAKVLEEMAEAMAHSLESLTDRKGTS